MGDLAEFYKEMRPQMKAASATKKASNLEKSRQLLITKCIKFEEKANGHFVILQGSKYDFWATTGLFICRKTRKRGRGVKNLIAALNGKPIKGED